MRVKSNGEPDSPRPADQVEDKLKAMAAELSSPPEVPARTKGSHATEQQKEIAAILWANGRDDQFIQDQLALSSAQLRRIKKSESWERVARAYREKHAHVAASHRSRMLEVVEDSYVALSQIVRDPHTPAKARITAIELVFDQAKISEAPEAASVDINLGFQQNNVEINAHTTTLLDDIKNTLPALLNMDVSKHVREGEEALPSAVLQQANEAERRAEVVEANFTGDDEAPTDEDL